MGEEKDKSQNETPSSSAENHNHHDHDHNQEPEAARNEEEQCVEHTEKPPSVEADSEAKPDEDENEGRTASDDHQETTSGGEPELPPDLSKVYFVARRNALEETLRGKLGYEGHSIDDVQKMSWEIVEREISTWIAAFNHCATVLFSCERKLSDAVFNDCPQLSTSSEAIFNNLSGGLVIQFLIFPEAVAMTKRSAEKLFKFLDLYETMRDHLPTAYDNFPPDYVNELKAEAALTRGRLGEGMVGIFSELENSIQSDSSKTQSPAERFIR
nr:exocyst complex component EXO70B1 [Ipomoea batatas]